MICAGPPKNRLAISAYHQLHLIAGRSNLAFSHGELFLRAIALISYAFEATNELLKIDMNIILGAAPVRPEKGGIIAMAGLVACHSRSHGLKLLSFSIFLSINPNVFDCWMRNSFREKDEAIVAST